MQTIFITGGSRSGKTSQALTLAQNSLSEIHYYLATAKPFDQEMKERIDLHKQERGNRFMTLEEPLEITACIQKNITTPNAVVVIDCLTLWLNNLLFEVEEETKIPSKNLQDYSAIYDFLELLKNPPCSLIIVSNEVGMGIVPQNRLARTFSDLAGKLNQETANLCGQVIFMVSGLPMVLKEESI